MAKMTPAERAAVQAAKKENSPANQEKIAANRASALAGSPDPNAGMGPDSPTSSFVPDVNKPGEGSWVNDNAAPASASVTAGGGGESQDNTEDYQVTRDKEIKRLRTLNSIAAMRGLMQSYGLESLMSVIEGYVTDGYDDSTIEQLIKTTPQYAARFPAMATLSRKNRAISEAEYISFEREAAQFERSYGLPAGMLGKSTVTTLLENEVSARELEERVTMAAAGAFQTSAEVKQQFKNFYGIDSGGLTAYFLDPEKALPLLNKQYASAQIGAEAAGQGVGIGSAMAEDLTIAGISREAASEGFGKVAGQKGLTTGRGDVVSQDELIKGNLLGSQEAQANITRAAAGRTGRFEQGGSYISGQGQTAGLGSAATR